MAYRMIGESNRCPAVFSLSALREGLACPAMPRAKFTHEATTRRQPEEVWRRLQDVETWSSIGPVEHVWDPVHDEEGLLVEYRWSASVGPTTYRGTANVIEAHVDSLMVLELDGGELAGTLSTRIEQNGSGSRITVDLGIVSKGTLSALFFPIVSEAVGRGLPAQVDRFVAGLDQPA